MKLSQALDSVYHMAVLKNYITLKVELVSVSLVRESVMALSTSNEMLCKVWLYNICDMILNH